MVYESTPLREFLTTGTDMASRLLYSIYGESFVSRLTHVRHRRDDEHGKSQVATATTEIHAVVVSYL